MQSSPSPTSIIANINQSNYLCSQTPDSSTPSTPTPQYKEDNIFLRPTKNNIRSNVDSNKSSHFKQVVIIQEEQNSRQSTPESNYAINSDTKSSYEIDSNQVKAGNYSFKNLAINNCIQKFSDSLNQESNKNDNFNEEVKIDEYSTKFYFTDNGVIPHNNEQNFDNDNYASDYHKERQLKDDATEVYNTNPPQTNNKHLSPEEK